MDPTLQPGSFPGFPRYDIGVHPETPPGRETASSKTPLPLTPVSAEDFARRKRRIVLACVGAGLLAVLVAFWIYRSSTAPVEAQQALDAGERLLKTNRYAEAILSFDRAISLKRDLAGAYLQRGRAQVLLMNLDAAIPDFTKVIQLRPNDPEAYLERAGVRLGQKDYPAVIADCGEAISRDPKLAYGYTLRGTAFRETGSLQKSLEDFNRAVELSPGLENYFQRAVTYQLMGEHKLAIADLGQVIDLFPSSPMGYLARAKSRAAIGDLAGARSDREAGRVLEDRAPGQ
jgi:tetratricopeptide (TPR) repeat protein